MDKPIYVTRPYLPPLEEFIPLLEQIWDSRILTNAGPFHQRFERELCDYLGVKHLSLFANGTLALITALKALRIRGEVITTPYSFVATAHALLWNEITPVFVDIDPNTLNLDPKKIEAAITPRTTAILAVHCYGNPCDVDAIQHIADTYNLKVIYDAAHAFGVECHCGSILRHGDLSVLSFHATKVFNTLEGGAIVMPDEKIKHHIDDLKNFGFSNETTVVACGINGKMNEIQAALGLLQLERVDDLIIKRAAIAQTYREALSTVSGIECVEPANARRANYAYFPVLVNENSSRSRDDIFNLLKQRGIVCRRYFYPLITSFPMYRDLNNQGSHRLSVAQRRTEQVLCLPIYPDLTYRQAADIADTIRILCG